jgi:site-specific DNA recombinase
MQVRLSQKRMAWEVQGQHPPMITEETFYRVQAILDGRNFNSPVVLAKRTRNNPDFPLRRIVRCGRCGQSFTGAWGKGKCSTYGYYFCIKRCGAKSNVPFTDIEP